jgi:hypothetical protein
MERQSLYVIDYRVEDDDLLRVLTDLLHKALHGVSADAITGYRYEFVAERLQDLETLFGAYGAHKGLAEVVAIGV